MHVIPDTTDHPRATRRPRLSLPALLAAVLACLVTAASAQEVTTQLSSPRTRVGQPVQLTVNVTGGRPAETPPTISVNGLRINLAGQRTSSSAQFGSGGFQTTTTTSYVYLVVPQFEGEFTIPSFTVTIDGRTYRTQPMQLAVGGGTQVPPNPTLPNIPGQTAPPPSKPRGDVQPYFAELVISKKKAYVGEVIPAELRFYFNSRIGGQLGERPEFGGEGFTVQKFSDATKREQVVNNENYVVFTFQTAITPVKSGKLEIPAAKLDARLQLPGSGTQGLPDIFGNFGGMLPPGMFSESQEVAVETRPVQIDVLPLPKEGRPENFSGAIGRFTLDATVSPKKTEPGEPLTLKATVSGRGNFEAMGAPVLTNDDGWRTYPPSESLSQSDAIGYTGEKNFEFALIARKDQTQTPGIEFSFFDPSTGKYETLTQSPLAVEASAGTSQPASPATSPTTNEPAAATPPPTAVPTPDIAVMAGGASNWQSILQRRDFWIANAALAIAWLALVAYFSIRRFATSEAGARAARVRHAKDLLNKLRSADPAAFDEAALKYLCAALAVDELDARSQTLALPLPAETRTELERFFDRHAESKYAAGAATPPSADERTATLAAVSKIKPDHAK